MDDTPYINFCDMSQTGRSFEFKSYVPRGIIPERNPMIFEAPSMRTINPISVEKMRYTAPDFERFCREEKEKKDRKDREMLSKSPGELMDIVDKTLKMF